jgi:hypothetical protein
MDVHLIDGTYELFRHFFAVPKVTDTNGREIGAVRGVLNSVLSMIERGATHIGVARVCNRPFTFRVIVLMATPLLFEARLPAFSFACRMRMPGREM